MRHRKARDLPKHAASGSIVSLVAAVVLLGLTSQQIARADSSGAGLAAPGSQLLPVTLAPVAAPPVAVRAGATPVINNGYKVSVGAEWVHLQTTAWNPRKNSAVLGLTKEHFELFEDGQRRQVDLCFASETPFHLILLLDVSASTTPFIKNLRKAATHFLDVLSPADRVSVVTFNSKVTLLQPFTADRQRAKEAIRATTPGGNTALYDALISSLQLLQGVKGRKAIILFSDGADNRLSDSRYGSKATFEELREVMFNGDSLIYSVFLQPKDPEDDRPAVTQAREELQRIADDSGARMYRPIRAGDLTKAYAQVARDLRHCYTLAYRRDGQPSGNIWHSLRVKVPHHPGIRILARKGFFSGDGSAD